MKYFERPWLFGFNDERFKGTGRTNALILSVCETIINKKYTNNIYLIVMAATDEEVNRIKIMINKKLFNFILQIKGLVKSGEEFHKLLDSSIMRKIIFGTPKSILLSNKLMGVRLIEDDIFIDHTVFEYADKYDQFCSYFDDLLREIKMRTIHI